MASKFMAFENVASTSSASMDQDDGGERIEMNASQYPNYQSNHQMHDGTATSADSSNTYGDGGVGGAVTAEEDDLNENFEEKTEKDLGYRKFIYNNSEQFKSIVGGLLLLMGSGIHIVWGIFRVFYLYNCDEPNTFYLRLVIWSWYIGAIIGCGSAGYAVLRFRKGHIYAFGGVLLSLSGVLLMASNNNTNLFLLISRIIGGYTQGLTYVIVIVHASENATKEFRELLMMIVGAVINYSILVSVLSFFHTEGLFKTGLLNGIGLVAFGVITVLVTLKHATETVPFILQTNGSELDALQTVAKLRKRPVAARSVHRDFMLLKNQVQDEIDHYGVPDFRSVLLPENRKNLIFCCYGRLCSVLSFNLPLIVIIMLFLRSWVDSGTKPQESACAGQCDYLTAYNNDQLEEYWNCTYGNLTEPAANQSEHKIEPVNKENSRPKRYAIENPSFFDIENVDSDAYSKWLKDHNGRNMKRDAADEKKRDDEKKVDDKKDDGKKDDEKKDDEKKKDEKKDEEKKDEEKKGEEKKDEEKKVEPAKKENPDEKGPKSENKDNSNTKEEHKPKDEGKKEDHKSESKGKPNPKDEQKSKHKGKPNTKDEQKSRKESNPKKESESQNEKNAKTGKAREEEKRNAMAGASATFFAHFVAILHSRELTLILLAWFIFGTITTLILYYFSLKRFIYRISLVLSSVLVFTGLFHSFGVLSTIFHICLIIYFNYVTIPIDVFGHCILAEAFPITLKAFSIASVAIVEHLVHILLITLYLTSWFHDSIIVFMCVVAFVSHEISRNLPEKANLPLGEAHQQYQNVDLMLFNDPKSGYNQQQEFI